MYKLLRALILGALLFTCSFSWAQQYTGCLLSAGTLHYQQNGTSGGKTNYDSSPSVSSGSVFCMAPLTSNTSCRVNNNGNPANQGTKRTFYMVQCPIDDYVPLLIIVTGGLGVFTIRKRIATLY